MESVVLTSLKRMSPVVTVFEEMRKRKKVECIRNNQEPTNREQQVRKMGEQMRSKMTERWSVAQHDEKWEGPMLQWI